MTTLGTNYPQMHDSSGSHALKFEAAEASIPIHPVLLGNHESYD